MLIAAHSIAGATAGTAIGSPFFAVLLGVVVHFLLDAIPHYDTTDQGRYTFRQLLLVGIDGLIAIFLLLKMRESHPGAGFVFGAIGGILPDLLLNLPPVNKILTRAKLFKRAESFHTHIQRMSLPPLPGLSVQLLVILLSLFLFYRFVI